MLRKLHLQPRLLIAFLTVSFFTLSTGILGYIQQKNIAESAVKSVSLVYILNNIYSYKINSDNSIHNMRRFEETAIQDYFQQIMDRTAKLQELMDEYAKLESEFSHIFRPEEMQDIANILTMYDETYLPILNEIIELHKKGETEKAISIYEKQLDPKYDHIFYNASITFEKVFETIKTNVGAKFDYAYDGALSILLTVLISIFVSVILTFVVTRSITVPLAEVKRTAEKMAGGNLNICFEESGKDEIAHLSTSLNKTVRQLQQIQRLRMESMEIRLEKEKAEAVSRSKSQFLAKMSHEIRTPMNAVIGMAELALREGIPGAAHNHVLTIKHAGSSLLSLINDILDISKIESGKLEITPTDYEFSSVINDVVSIIKTRMIDTTLEFTVDIAGDVQNELFGDEIRIRQILLNLLSNAVKYTEKGSILLKIRNELTEVEDTVNFIMEVTDTGKGIKEEDFGKLFGEFVQLDLEENKGIEGTGLGLSITKSLVKAMGGDIAVQSEYGAGSTFTVTLPQKIRGDGKFGDGTANSYAVKEESLIKFTAPDAHILIVDDIGTNLAVVEGLLLPYKVQMDLCNSGAEAIEAIKANTYDLVLMDHMMPVMDGIEATALIRKMDGECYTKLPIVALTANAISGAKEMFLQNGFSDFLAKPIEVAKLYRILEKWIPVQKRMAVEERVCGCTQNIAYTDIAIEGVDVKIGMARTGGTEEGYLLTLAVFRKDGLEIINSVKESLENGDTQKYITNVHGLKSAAANVGAMKLSEAAKELEAAGKQGDRALIDKNTPALLNDLETLLHNVSNVITAKKELSNSSNINADTLKTALTALRTAIDDLNPGAINAAVKELRPFENAAETGETTENILQNVLNGEYDEALALIETLLPSNKENDS